MLIGRDAELSAVRAALERERLVTLVGTGGVGKTTLALAVVRDMDPTPVTVRLAPLEPAAGDAFGDHAAGSAGFTSEALLLEALAAQPRLVVVDNCEHVLDDAAGLTERILGASPQVRVLATSREPLDLGTERIVRIDPLGTDGVDSDAVRLFRWMVERHGATVADAAEHVEELCRRLDGLPLALELAAARASSMTAAEMNAHLESRLSVLAGRTRRGPDRHQSLEATIAWSYQMLDGDLQRLLNRLSLFRGAFTVEFAEFVAPDGVQAIDALADLVDRSLLVHEPHLGTSWFRLLETIKAFAGERLAASAEAAAVADGLVDRLAVYAADLDRLGAVADAHVPQQLTHVYESLRWAIDMAVRNDAEPSRAHALVSPLWWLEDVGHQASCAAAIRSVLARWPDGSVGSSTALGILGALVRIAGDADAAARHAHDALAAAPGPGHAYARRTLGQIARGVGEWKAALEEFELGRQAAADAGHPALAVEIAMHGAMTMARAGEVAAAIEWLDALVEEAAEYPHARAWAAMFLCWILHGVDDERAIEIATRELGEAERIGNAWGRAAAHTDLAVSDLQNEAHAAAARHLRAAVELYDAMNNRTDITVATTLASCLLVSLGRRDVASRVEALTSSYLRGTWGPFEQALFDELGPVPSGDGARPMGVGELLAVLDDIGDDGAPERSVNAPNRFRPDGDHWAVSFGGISTSVRSSKGMADLHRLLSSPGRDIPAVDLMGAAVDQASSGAVADTRARREIEDRIRGLQETIDTADAMNDTARAATATAELDELVDALSRMYGLGGRERHADGSAERARSAVTARIRSTIKRIGTAHASLGRHLTASVTTGRFCRYDPPEPTSWEL